MPKAFKDLLVQPPADLRTMRSGALVQQQATRSSKGEVPNGVFILDLYDDHSKFKNTLEKSIRTLYQNLDAFKMYYHDKKTEDDNKPRVSNGTFFFERDLLPGKKLILGLIKPTSEFTFLPDKISKAIPFSSNRFPEILKRLNIEADSTDAGSMRQTLALCEKPAIKGEEVYCATSLESVLDFAVSKLGKNIRLVSTEFERETQDQNTV
ncbi:hypothetical protein PIB30_091406 [Stylosanthes scabra]|uniref:BURP domain-containing protein n=1 Tax=Stylosanthes scabra TaxID=79078 RepID=A0ABU6YTI5_9FABA|nr:hypothetical protein [Stylosanthes scabra]